MRKNKSKIRVRVRLRVRVRVRVKVRVRVLYLTSDSVNSISSHLKWVLVAECDTQQSKSANSKAIGGLQRFSCDVNNKAIYAAEWTIYRDIFSIFHILLHRGSHSVGLFLVTNILMLSFIYITHVYLAYYLLGMSIAATYQWLFGLPCAPFY